MKLFRNLSRERKAFYLLVGCIVFFSAGLMLLTIGALAHVNPNDNFAGLFKWEKLMNLVYTLIPEVQ